MGWWGGGLCFFFFLFLFVSLFLVTHNIHEYFNTSDRDPCKHRKWLLYYKCIGTCLQHAGPGQADLWVPGVSQTLKCLTYTQTYLTKFRLCHLACADQQHICTWALLTVTYAKPVVIHTWSLAIYIKAHDHKRTQVGRDFMRCPSQYPALTSGSYEIRPSCSGLYQMAPENLRE